MVFPRLPLPPLETLPILYEIGKKVWNFIKGSNIKDEPGINKRSSAQDISNMTAALNEIRQNVLKEGTPIVNEIKDSVASYVEELSMLIDEKSKVLKKYGFSRRTFDRTLQELNRNIQGFWDSEINKKISLDSLECHSILELPPGMKKENDMKEFVSKVINETIAAYTDNIRFVLNQLYEDFEYDIDEVSKQIEMNLDVYNKIDVSLMNKDGLSYEQNLKIAQTKIIICKEILSRLEK